MSLLDDMRSERLYDYSSPELAESFCHASRLCCRLRSLYPGHPDYRAVLEELIPGIPESATIVAPFYCDHGHGIRLGEEVFINADCVLLDGGLITIGAHTRIGPKCQLYTPTHPMDAEERAGREAAGRLACLLAERADCVVQMFCGIPTVLKGELPQC